MKGSVPYYAQTAEFTCGPACVLMAMKHFDPTLSVRRELEFEVWRQCNMIGIRGADPYGLAVPLLDAGYRVRLITKRKRFVLNRGAWLSRLRRYLSREEIELSFLGLRMNERRAGFRGLTTVYKHPDIDDLINATSQGLLPITLVHMGVVHKLDIPHWVVVTGIDDHDVYFNDPYPPNGRRDLSLPHKRFQKILDDIYGRIGCSPSILLVGKA